ncbi:MAG TPA: hypothetical protein ENF67_00625 [Candidatus Pacearchaeota archaeon]|nr:hypothetical protein [Candidatus Pacearchaeota archaeon]
MGSFDAYAKKLDSIVTKLPTHVRYYEKDQSPLIVFADFTKELRNILKYLKAEIIIEQEVDGIVRVVFDPTKSPYFRLGHFRVDFDRREERKDVDKRLEAIIGIGFDVVVGREYEDDEKPDLITEFEYVTEIGECLFATDVNVYKPENWRDALNDFFDISKVR